jgi:hypothetical protein
MSILRGKILKSTISEDIPSYDFVDKLLGAGFNEDLMCNSTALVFHIKGIFISFDSSSSGHLSSAQLMEAVKALGLDPSR